MDQQEYDELISRGERHLKKALVSKQSALDALVRAGLVTEGGQPTEPYAPGEKPDSLDFTQLLPVD